MCSKRYTNLPSDYSKQQRRLLRKNQTKGEIALWIQLKNRYKGFKFRRQVSIGDCVVDFYCHKLKLIIEVDGGIHNEKEQKDHDIRRDHWLKSKGYNIKRVCNEDCVYSMEIVLEEIDKIIDCLSK